MSEKKNRSLLSILKFKILGGLIPEGNLGLSVIGYKNYVGGKWDEIGNLQFEYIIGQGLKPDNCFLDIGCGALRGGVRFIEFLNPGNYLGFDKEEKLIKIGKKKVLTRKILDERKPEFKLSDNFDFSGFSKIPDYSLALSLFTHLSDKDIQVCMKNLRKFVNKGHIFYATFFEGNSSNNPSTSHSLDHFDFTRNEMAGFGNENGWKPEYIGDWGHPRDQKMFKYTAV
ncbi:MAG: class I SAM-dependent methyltransferase [Acidobacteriota bacterium]